MTWLRCTYSSPYKSYVIPLKIVKVKIQMLSIMRKMQFWVSQGFRIDNSGIRTENIFLSYSTPIRTSKRLLANTITCSEEWRGECWSRTSCNFCTFVAITQKKTENWRWFFERWQRINYEFYIYLNFIDWLIYMGLYFWA